MSKAVDYLLDSKGNLLLTNNDLTVGFSDDQHIKDNINAFPGWWKQYPLDGVGIAAYQKARIIGQVLIKKMRQELEGDGYIVRNPKAYILNNILYVTPDSKRI